MEAIIYITIFIIGALFGSFYTLATYRIPRSQDITHTRSYCPNCDHKLGFFDMFPIFSYILLGGKCRYCKKKISPRYITLEILSGLVFVAVFYFMKIDFSDIHKINISKLIQYGFMTLYITYIFLSAWIDKENNKIEKTVSIFGIIISIMYIAYLCIVENANIYRYAIYILFYIMVLILDTISLKKIANSIYIYGITIIIITMAIFMGELITLSSIGLVGIIILAKMLIKKLQKSKNKMVKNNEKLLSKETIAFYIGISNVITYIIINCVYNFIK